MRILITGMTGMIGTHFEKEAINRGHDVFGCSRNSSFSRYQEPPPSNFIGCDILDKDTLRNIINKVSPDAIIHLAAQAFNGESWQCENLTHATNINGTLNLLQASRETVPDAKILIACSSAEYGVFPHKDCPLKEDLQPLRPVSPYGVSKMVAEALGFQYFTNYQMHILLPRLFIHLGTCHPPVTAVQNFARQLALISKQKQPPVIQCGDLETSRDFVDVRDGVDALFLILEKAPPGVPINICSGQHYKMKKILDILIGISGLDVKIQYNDKYLRPSDEAVLVGDNTKLKSLGWVQNYSIEQTLNRIYRDWMSRI